MYGFDAFHKRKAKSFGYMTNDVGNKPSGSTARASAAKAIPNGVRNKGPKN